MSSGNCSRPLVGWLAGCAASTATMCGFGLVVLTIAAGSDLKRLFGAGIALLLFAGIDFAITCAMTAAPAALIIWSSERFAIRSVSFYGRAGACVGAASLSLLLQVNWRLLLTVGWLFVIAGFVAGAIYWHVAGRYAGHPRRLGNGTPSR